MRKTIEFSQVFRLLFPYFSVANKDIFRKGNKINIKVKWSCLEGIAEGGVASGYIGVKGNKFSA